MRGRPRRRGSTRRPTAWTTWSRRVAISFTGDDSTLVAGAGWETHAAASGAAALRGIFVHPDCVGGGLGRRMVAAVEDAAFRSGHTRFFVPSSLNAVGFYERLGYRKEGNAEIALHGSQVVYCRMWKDVA
jgi:GNAT superfamily N-acetyltransferase